MTTTAASTCSTCSGTIARARIDLPASCLQEYSPREQKLIGQRRLIFRGTSIGFTEGPHLYKRGGYYHLLVAEGGTFWGHAVTMARSRNIDGPYELHPDTYVLTARDRPDSPLQRAGHASLVETQDGETYMAYLCGRPLPNRGRCVLGRETAIQKMVWSEDGWLRTDRRPRRAAGERAGAEPAAAPVPARRVSRRILIRRNCPSTSNGCARPIPSGFGA